MQFNIGDVHDLVRTRNAMRGVDIVFNAAGLKQVPNFKFAPFEAVMTNIIGAHNPNKGSARETYNISGNNELENIKPLHVV